MKKLKVFLKNCHGIRLLESTLDFSKGNAVAIYAPNGTMKTSFARTFKEFAAGEASGDRMFPGRPSERSISDEAGNPIDPCDVVVILAYDEDLGTTESTSTLLVNADLRREYEGLHEELATAARELLAALGKQAGTRQQIIQVISPASRDADQHFFAALGEIYEAAAKQETAPFADVPYDLIFNDKVLPILSSPALVRALARYVTRLSELLRESRFFSRDSFSYYNAEKVATSLGDNGFFSAGHALLLRGEEGEPVTVSKRAELDSLIAAEQERISDDPGIRQSLETVRKALNKNKETRDFHQYIADHPALLPELLDVEELRRKLWVSYIKAQDQLCDHVIARYRRAQRRDEEIERQAASERTRWERVIDIFNDRFSVPFTLTAKNHSRVVLGRDKFLEIGFEFADGAERAVVGKSDLLKVLSNGEKKALYILNVLFEVEARRSSGRETLFIVDDIAESFDYKNKYAIVQYLKEMAADENFRLVIATHNFDFFRTLESRKITAYPNCLMAQRHEDRVVLDGAQWIRNPFTGDLKKAFFTDGMKRIACVPFIRNIIEYTRGGQDPDYLTLTSLLHWKPDTAAITQGALDEIFHRSFGESGSWESPQEPVIDLIHTKATEALTAGDSANFANKIVLSVAIRLLAEGHMVHVINDPARTGGISAKQSHTLYEAYRDTAGGAAGALRILDSVMLMTPENIHVNSFMYEPIIDMSDTHLRRLFSEVSALPRR